MTDRMGYAFARDQMTTYDAEYLIRQMSHQQVLDVIRRDVRSIMSLMSLVAEYDVEMLAEEMNGKEDVVVYEVNVAFREEENAPYIYVNYTAASVTWKQRLSAKLNLHGLKSFDAGLKMLVNGIRENIMKTKKEKEGGSSEQ